MSLPELERRALEGAELRFVDGGGGQATVAGYAAVFGELSEDLGGWREQIDPGAFRGAIKGDIRALIEHDPSMVLGRTKAKTLRIATDERGLRVEIDLPDTASARDLATSMKRGDVTGMSFGFRTLKDRWDRQQDFDLRTILAVELFDVSVVTFPAYPQTTAALRSLDAAHADMARARADHARRAAAIRAATLA